MKLEQDKTEEKTEMSFMDIQGMGALPDSVHQMVTLVTKAAMGFFLTYYSLNELMSEFKEYKKAISKKEAANAS